MVKVSVVLPCYNVEKYIRRGLDSVLAQTLSEWEAILVDDGATDNTGNICDEYAKKDARFRVIHQQNQGVSCARNTGMMAATGQLLYFMDPDDWIESGCFARCYDVYMQYKCDIIHFGAKWHELTHAYEIKKEFGVYKGMDIIDKFTGPIMGFDQNVLNQYYAGESIWSYAFLGGLWVFMFNREYIVNSGIVAMADMRYGQDGVFLMEATYKAKEIVAVPDVFYNYDIRNDGAIGRKKTPLEWYDNRYRLMLHRCRIRKMISETDMQQYYLGTNIFTSLHQAINLSVKIAYFKQFNKFVTHPDVKESIRRVSTKNAPSQFSIPVRLLKMHCQFILFVGLWILRKIGYYLPDKL